MVDLKKEFKPYNPKKQSLEMMRQIERVVKIQEKKGFKVNSKQLHYIMVRAGYLPFTTNAYRSLSRCLNRARLGGWLDWDILLESYDCMYYDNTIDVEGIEQTLDTHTEVWTDKVTQMSMLIESVSDPSIPVRATGGYPTSWWILRKVEKFKSLNRPVRIIVATDLTFAGTVIVEDLINRFELLGMPQSDDFEIVRIGFTNKLAKKLKLPASKEKDKNQKQLFESKHGKGSYELESLPPEKLSELIWEHIE